MDHHYWFLLSNYQFALSALPSAVSLFRNNIIRRDIAFIYRVIGCQVLSLCDYWLAFRVVNWLHFWNLLLYAPFLFSKNIPPRHDDIDIACYSRIIDTWFDVISTHDRLILCISFLWGFVWHASMGPLAFFLIVETVSKWREFSRFRQILYEILVTNDFIHIKLMAHILSQLCHR